MNDPSRIFIVTGLYKRKAMPHDGRGDRGHPIRRRRSERGPAMAATATATRKPAATRKGPGARPATADAADAARAVADAARTAAAAAKADAAREARRAAAMAAAVAENAAK
jgi:hypothetical protein